MIVNKQFARTLCPWWFTMSNLRHIGRHPFSSVDKQGCHSEVAWEKHWAIPVWKFGIIVFLLLLIIKERNLINYLYPATKQFSV